MKGKVNSKPASVLYTFDIKHRYLHLHLHLYLLYKLSLGSIFVLFCLIILVQLFFRLSFFTNKKILNLTQFLINNFLQCCAT